MSTYGKKSLLWWSYEKALEDPDRFVNTQRDLQKQIIDKWYPIGMLCKRKSIFGSTFGLYEVISYRESDICWEVQIKDRQNYVQFQNPSFFIPQDDWKKTFLRDLRLQNLLKK
jgi:hypothetical protein